MMKNLFIFFKHTNKENKTMVNCDYNYYRDISVPNILLVKTI